MAKNEFGKKEIDFICSAFESKKPVVIPTDTVYGIISSALDKLAVLKLYKIRKRNLEKPFIILISSLKDLFKFEIKITPEQKSYLRKIWPNPITVIFDCPEKEFSYLYRKQKTLAFRMPNDKWLLRLIKKVGPVVAPSANLEGQVEAKTIKEAYSYFGDKALYLDGGRMSGKSSTIVSLSGGEFKIIREGKYKIKKNEYFRSNINN